jgi:polyisoprenoid-binding protein YceI
MSDKLSHLPRNRRGTAFRESTHSAPTAVAIPGYLAGTWKVDPMHSEIAFAVRLLTVGKMRGRFSRYDVALVTSEEPLGSSVAATIELASIDSRNEKRDNHLGSADLLAVDAHPTGSYRSTDIRHTDDGWVIGGELTLHGVTRYVPLTVTENRFGPDANGGRRVRFCATAQISRGEFGIDRWNRGGVVIGDKVSISLEIEAVRQT